MKAYISKTAGFVLKYKWLIIGFNFLLIGVLVFGMAQRGMRFGDHTKYMAKVLQDPLSADSNHVDEPPIFNASYKVFFKADNEDLVAFENIQEEFSKEDMILAVIKSKSGDLFTNKNLSSLKELTNRSWEIPYAARVNGLTNFNYTTVEKEFIPEEEREEGTPEFIDNLLVEDFIYTLPFNDSLLMAKKQLALTDSLMPKFLLSKKGDVTQLMVRTIIPESFPDGFMEARKGMEDLVAKTLAENDDLDIQLGGTVILNTSFAEFFQKDMSTLIPLMLGLILLFLILTLRSFWGTVLPLGLLMTSVFFPISLFVGWLGLSLTNVSANVNQILVAVAIADSVHVMAIYYRERRRGIAREIAIRTTIEKNFLPCLITSITTSIGFFSLLLMEMPPFQDLGLFAGVGTLFAFFASLYTLPAILAVVPEFPDRIVDWFFGLFSKKAPSKEIQEDIHSPFMASLENIMVKNARYVRIFSLVTLGLGIYGTFQIVMDNNAVKYFKEGTQFRNAVEEIETSIIGTNPIEFMFDSGEENGVYEPEFLKKIERFQNFVLSEPDLNVTYVSAITDVVKRLNKTMNGDVDSQYFIPSINKVLAEGDTLSARRLISQYLFLYQMSLPQGMDLTNQMSLDNSKTRVTAFMTSTASTEQLAAVDKMNAWLAKEMPEMKARGTGVPVMFGKMFLSAIPGMMESLLVSLILITITLMFTFKSVKFGLFSMIPNVWPILFLFGIVGFTGYVVDMSVAVVGMITLGIAVDDSVHFMVKYLQFRRHGMAQKEAISETFHQVGPALLFTSIILIAGFAILMASQFMLNANLGKFCAAIIALALFADFVVLPSFLLIFDRREKV